MRNHPKYRWGILVFIAFTLALVITGPGSSLAVLFDEIGRDLNLSLVQIGMIWGSGSLLAIFSGSLAGALIDRFGPKRVLIAGILLLGTANAVRALAQDFPALLFIVLMAGGVVPMVSTSGFKISGIWFHKQLGTANSVVSMGMAGGMVLGSLLGASVLSPALGGWRNTMLFFGGLAALITVPWILINPLPEQSAAGGKPAAVPMRQALAHIFRQKSLWLLGLAYLGVGACQQGISGYLALYLRSIGWPGARADAAVSLIYVASLLLILPIGFLSDRLPSRKTILLATLALMAAGSGWLPAAQGWAVWAAVVLAGMTRDGTMSVLLTVTIDDENVGPTYAGTATGFAMTFFFIGGLISPPLGNMLAGIAPGAPFVFWSAAAGLGFVSLLLARSSRISAAGAAVPARR
ncbi:MAG: MFS transporter [Anaerolineales bacterium]|nr:MFS transporter [Anaerolineales bacterium]